MPQMIISEPVVHVEEGPVADKTRPACTECQRRKQKCNREWPCNHCVKRKVADQCRFSAFVDAEKPAVDATRKRQFVDKGDSPGTEFATSTGALTQDEVSGFKELGYMPSHHLYRLALNDDPGDARKAHANMPSLEVLPQLSRALEVLPPRPYTDLLVATFKDNVNFHYYILYPPSFLEQYRAWWVKRATKEPLDLSWTCLLLIVCACATQYLDSETQEQLESDLGETAQALTNRFQAAAQELGNVVPSRDRNFQYVQYLIHTCYWFKSEARFVECWHSLNSAVREAQEVSMHREKVNCLLPEFDREMRRRVWAILDTWDWQISGLLSRPLIIDRDDCDVELPSLALEKGWPSPIMHMKLQSKLIGQLSKKYGKAMNLMVATPSGVQEYRQLLENWRDTFPRSYNGDNPDTSLDKQHPWLILHRHYLQTISLLMILDPFKSYLTRTPARDASKAWMDVRSTGIDYCLKLMGALRGFFTYLFPRDAKFHFILFCIFDVSTILCSAVLHDEKCDLPRRDEVYESINLAADMLQQLNSVTKSAKTSNDVLQKLKARLPDPKAKPSGTPAATAREIKYPTKKVKKETSITPASSDSSHNIQGGNGLSAEIPTNQPNGCNTPCASATDATPLDWGETAVPPQDNGINLNGSTAEAGNGHEDYPAHTLNNAHPNDSDTVRNIAYPSSTLYGDQYVPPSITHPPTHDTDAAHDTNAAHHPHVDTNYLPENFTGHHSALVMPPAVPEPEVAPAPLVFNGTFEDLGFGNITQGDFGDFGEMWGWTQLDLGYTPRNFYEQHPSQSWDPDQQQ